MISRKRQLTQLFGEHHKSVLAHLVGTNKRTVQRWLNGSQEMPDDVADKLGRTYEIWKFRGLSN